MELDQVSHTRKKSQFIMPKTHRILLILAAAFMLTCCGVSHAEVGLPPGRVELRGFGELKINRHADVAKPDDSGSWVTFTATDASHATLCASKFLADYTAMGPVRIVTDSGLPGTVLTLDQAGWWVLGVEDRRFHVLFAPTRDELAARCDKVGVKQWQAVTPHAYPAWLDCFDNASVGFWVLGGGVLPKDLEADMRWFGENHFTMCATGASESRLVAPGVLDTTVWDWYAAKARQYGVPYRMLLSWTSPERPAWVRNIVPLPHVPPADGPEVNAPGFGYQSLSAESGWEPITATDPWLLDARRRIAEHVGADPWFTGHHASPELGGCSILGLERVAAMPETRTAWHNYLRNELHLDLAAVSLRHTGRAGAYVNWDAIPVPLPKEFAGWDPATVIDLRGAWQGHADRTKQGEKAGWFDPAHAPDGWVPANCNDSMLQMYDSGSPENSPAYWLRRNFTVPAERTAAPLYVHISRNWWHGPRTRLQVWLNGKPLKDLTDYAPVMPDWDLCFALGDSVLAGNNQIVINTMGGAVPSYIFVSPNGRQVFPNLAEPINRRYFDALNFGAWLRGVFLDTAMAATRQGDPNRPMKVMAPGDHHDVFNALYTRYGAYPHDTGQTGACWAPWTTSMNQAHGGQHSSEPGSPGGTVDELRQMFAFYFMLGNDAVDIVFHNDLYRTNPQLAAWISQNRQLLNCIGKMEKVRPQVAVLRSNRTVRLGFQSPYNWDITRGELQACGRTGQMVDLPEVAAGLADAYPVLFDDGTQVMTDEDVTAIEAYVRRGATFIAIHETGMHTPSRVNVWPIERLTGLRVKQNAPIGGKQIRFSDTQNLLPALRGRSIDGWGLMLDWTKTDVTGKAISLDATDSQVETIAAWQDNLGVAVGRRVLGKGQVITMGSTFWRNSHDLDKAFRGAANSRPYLDQLLSSLGVPRQSITVSSDVWAESWRSKNGIFDLYPVTYMRSKQEGPSSGDVILQRPAVPAAVWEVSKTEVPVQTSRFDNGHLTLPSIAVEPLLPRLFAAPRADLQLSALYWLDVQQRQWGALAKPKPVAAPPAAPADALVLPLIENWRMTADVPADGWTDRAEVSASWKSVRLGSFAAMGIQEDAQVRAFRSVPVPASWQGQSIRLVFDAPNWFWGLNPQARIWVGGRPLSVADYAPVNAADPVLRSQRCASFNIDVTDRVRAGNIDLAIEIDGRVDYKIYRPRPAGVTGAFYLQAQTKPLAEKALTAWSAATDYNVFTPAPVGKPAQYIYLETRFTLPKTWPAKRLFLRAPDATLNLLVVNNTVVLVPLAMDRLDISGLVTRDGENIIRWLPTGGSGGMGGWPVLLRFDALVTRVVPELHLAWWP